MSKENVYGLEINTYGDMATLARRLLTLHMGLLVLYFLSGPLAIGGAALSPRVMERKDHSSMSSLSNRNAEYEIPFGLLTMAGGVIMFVIVYKGINSDNKEMLTGTMFCDGCCAACNCLLGFCGCAGMATTCLLKAYFEEEDPCVCNGSIDLDDRGCVERCSVCFDTAKCRKEVAEFNDGFGVSMGFWTLWTLVVCIQMCLCALTAVRLSWARSNMKSTPFCKEPPQIGGNVVVGAPVRSHTYEHDL